jgi:hypothetical protein
MIHHFARLTGIPEDFAPSALGFVGASVSTATIYLADAASGVADPEVQGWVQLGGTIGLITFLVYACRTLWMALQDARNATTLAQAAAVDAASKAARAVAEAVQAAEVRMAEERSAFIAAKEALEKEIRTDWKQQNDALMKVLNRIDPTP